MYQIKRSNGLWFIVDDKGELVKGTGNFKTLEQARVAEAALPPIVAEPVQKMNRSSGKK